MSFTVIAFLYAGDGGLDALRNFEARVLLIAADHGGRLESAFIPADEPCTVDPPPDEVHILTFPAAEAFQAYRGDARHAELAPVRERAIRRTEVVASGETVRYT